MALALVGVPAPFENGLTYRVPEQLKDSLEIGCRVRVPLANRLVVGLLIETDSSIPQHDDFLPRDILEIIDARPVLTSNQIALARFISEYYFAPIFDCLRLMFPGDLPAFGDIKAIPASNRKKSGHETRAKASAYSEAPIEKSTFELRQEQVFALEELVTRLNENKYASYLLKGLTGSGKTEVYLRLIAENVARGRGTIVLVPEIGLVSAVEQQLEERFGSLVEKMHSSLSKVRRHRAWQRIKSGEARIVLGPRSALFAPVENLGLIVVDEEHDTSFKQDSNPRYNARDVAQIRGRLESALVLLISATPSLETTHNVRLHKYRQVSLRDRAGIGLLPEGILVDLRTDKSALDPENALLSHRLVHEIAETLEAGDQIILLRNRRGYAPLVLCRACGFRLTCHECALCLTAHARQNILLCHYCGTRQEMPLCCPHCFEPSLQLMGTGTERVEERIRQQFPAVSVDVLDSDVASPQEAQRILVRFGARETQILIGTQLVAKGHHFPHVALAAVLMADSYLSFPDFRAAERTFALLTQLIGRAGRGMKMGRFVLQTFYPEHYAIRALLQHGDEEFYEQELHFRQTFQYPPFSRMASIVSRAKSRPDAEAAIHELARHFAGGARNSGLLAQGPAPCPIERLRGEWRFQLILRSSSGKKLHESIHRAISKISRKTLDRITIDIDPQSLL